MCAATPTRRPGDALILTKPLGVGIYSAAIKKGVLPHGGYAEMIATTTLLNRVGAELAKDEDVHAITDVTGFGLLGHALEMARGSGADAGDPRSTTLPLARRGRGAGAAGQRHRRVASQLGELWRERRLPDGLAGLAAPSADRSADLGRPAGRLRAGARRRDRADDRGGGLSGRADHRPRRGRTRQGPDRRVIEKGGRVRASAVIGQWFAPETHWVRLAKHN